ncbi:MAG: 2-oxo acid dehydrogenase subunit E2 [Arsenophonus sp.]
MPIEIKVPDIGTNELEVTEIMVKVGDKIDIEESLITIEGEKTSIEVPSPEAGIVKEIKVKVGDKVTTGKLIMVFDVEKKAMKTNFKINSNLKIDEINKKNLDQARNESKKVILSDINNNEINVTNIMVNIGDKILVEQSSITIEGENRSVKVATPFSGEVREIKIIKNDKDKTDSIIIFFRINTKESLKINSDKISIKSITPSFRLPHTSYDIIAKDIFESKNKSIKNETHIHATPLIRRLAYEFDINLSNVNGSGRKGRIMREDIQSYLKESIRHFEVRVDKYDFMSCIQQWPEINFSKFGEVEEIKLSRIQQAFSSNMNRNWVMIPHVTIMEDADITELEIFRKQQNKEMEELKTGIKITILVFVMKSVAQVLEEMILFNSSISKDVQRLTLKKYVHIGIAVDTVNGLVVPVIRDVNKKGIIELSQKLMEISKKARDGKLTMSDMQGGSFTISSLGSIGTTRFTPIINAPEVAIIGLSRSSIKPVWNGSEFISRLILPMSLSFDHRIINGADGARFITRISKLMSDIRYLVM